MQEVISRLSNENYSTQIDSGAHQILCDEPLEKGGKNKGMRPTDLLLSSLGSCTAITLRMYSERKQVDLGEIIVRCCLHPAKKDTLRQIEVYIRFGQSIEESLMQRMDKIAHACPIHKMLAPGCEIKVIFEN